MMVMDMGRSVCGMTLCYRLLLNSKQRERSVPHECKCNAYGYNHFKSHEEQGAKGDAIHSPQDRHQISWVRPSLLALIGLSC